MGRAHDLFRILRGESARALQAGFYCSALQLERNTQAGGFHFMRESSCEDPHAVSNLLIGRDNLPDSSTFTLTPCEVYETRGFATGIDPMMGVANIADRDS
jgi:hypothetical protein